MTVEKAGEARLYANQNMEEADLVALAQGSAAVFSSRCPGKPSANEDVAAAIPCTDGQAVLMVADGVGGGAGGELAASRAVEAIQKAIQKASREGWKMRTAILNGFEEANHSVQELGIGAGTTLAVVELDDGVVRPYHVGDSTILVVGQRGKVKLQTLSHSPVGYAVEAGVLNAVDAMHHEDRHVVSNFIGSPQMRIELGPSIKLAALDTLLLASDGLLDNLHQEEIVERLRKGSLSDVSRRLATDSTQRMLQPAADQPSKPDDLTFIVYRRRNGRASR
ncbi:MAG: protein phosphatase 2C domain-containing protein [Pirellulales bacterium]